MDERFLALTGTTLDDVRGDGWRRLLPPGEGEGYVAAWRSALRRDGPVRVTLRVRDRDGQLHLIRIVGVRDGDGWSGLWLDVDAGVNAELVEALDALTRVAAMTPRFTRDATTSELVREVCTTALATFDATYASLWRVQDGQALLVERLPADVPGWEPGAVVELWQMPDVLAAVESGAADFYSEDAVDEVTAGWMRRLGMRAGVRLPLHTGERVEFVLGLGWTELIRPPSPGFIAAAERFADHAGRALQNALERDRHLRQAIEINDDVAQALAVAQLALGAGDTRAAQDAIDGALAAARRVVSELLAGREGTPGALRREAPTGF